jgi:hypothetical protein
MAAATAQQTNTRLQFFKASITIRLIKATCILIANPPMDKEHGFGFLGRKKSCGLKKHCLRFLG